MVSAADVVNARQIEMAERSVANWRRYYPDWEGGDEHEAFFRAGLAARRFFMESSPTNRTAAVHAVVIAHIASGYAVNVDDVVPTEGDQSGERRRELIAEINRWLEEMRSRALIG